MNYYSSKFRFRPIALLVALIGIGLLGCSNRYIDEVDRGEGFNYTPGYPEVRLSASGYVNQDDQTRIIVSAGVVYGSLVYKNVDNMMQAEIGIDVQLIRKVKDGDDQATAIEYSYTIRREDENIINNQDVFRFEKEYDAEPGEYEIRVSVTDRTSDRISTAETETSIPDPQGTESEITEIRILGKDSSNPSTGFQAVNTYDVPGRLDSLLFTLQVTNNNAQEELTLEGRLLKFNSDSSIARRMNFTNYSPSSMPYKGIEYDEFEVVQSSRRVLTENGSVQIEYVFTDLARGNYRLEVRSEREEDELYKARDFSIKSKNYPSLKSPRELARPLYYLMDEKEYEQLLAINSNDSLKKAIDRFWLSNIQNSNVARNVIELYYQRVEEANKQFSNFKEGWKTDTGMIYILFGPPWYTNVFSDEMLWSYSYNRQDPEKNFYFYRTKLNSKYYPFYNYLLSRSIEYNSIHYNQVEKWLSGFILRDNL